MHIVFTAISGEQQGLVQEYTKLPVNIGRYPDNDIVITDLIVSRKHCRITLEESKLVICDLDSKNGTYVNGARLKNTSSIVDGDIITIGEINLQLSVSN